MTSGCQRSWTWEWPDKNSESAELKVQIMVCNVIGQVINKL